METQVNKSDQLLKLYHEDNLVALISDHSPNGFEMHGSLQLTEKAAAYKAVLDYWADPNKDPQQEPPFPTSLFENWFVEDQEGVRHEICIPGVFTRDGQEEIHVALFLIPLFYV